MSDVCLLLFHKANFLLVPLLFQKFSLFSDSKQSMTLLYYNRVSTHIVKSGKSKNISGRFSKKLKSQRILVSHPDKCSYYKTTYLTFTWMGEKYLWAIALLKVWYLCGVYIVWFCLLVVETAILDFVLLQCEVRNA